nr:MAG TPA: hypothetical protein [Caudoviricetes sp.]
MPLLEGKTPSHLFCCPKFQYFRSKSPLRCPVFCNCPLHILHLIRNHYPKQP